MENLKIETRQRLLQAIDSKYETLSDLKSTHEADIESLTQTIDSLQVTSFSLLSTIRIMYEIGSNDNQSESDLSISLFQSFRISLMTP